MKPDTQAADVVTAEMIDKAMDAVEETEPCDIDAYFVAATDNQMRAALIASGLPAEVARLREDLAGAVALRNIWHDKAKLQDAELSRLKSENVMIRAWMSRCELAEAELSRLRGELSEARKKIRNLISVLPDTRALLIAREDALATIKDQQP